MRFSSRKFRTGPDSVRRIRRLRARSVCGPSLLRDGMVLLNFPPVGHGVLAAESR